MNKYLFTGISVFVFLFNYCSNGQDNIGKTKLEAKIFAEKLNATPGALLLDVRTPEEFGKGHLINAVNIDWNNENFDTEIASYNRTRPVFIYCLVGGRSAAAAKKMRADGFKEVYEMEGGLMKWRAASLPESTTSAISSAGLTREQFDAYLNTDKLVLVDFYADWCPPCKKMKPYLEEIKRDMNDQVEVIRINADDNQAICKALHIDALPVLHLYKNRKLTWSNTGFADKETVLKQLH